MTVQTFPNILIRASAGTGKTYQLSNRFIKLLHCGVLPEQILAVTFTRLAAGEILDRVMMRLAVAAADEERCQHLAAAIDDSSLTPHRCLDLLEQLTHQLHRLRIETLDSYFARLARSFSLELGLPPGWKIVEEVQDQQIRTQSIQALLRNDAYMLSALLRLLFKGEAERSITQQLLDVIWDLYNLYRESEAAAWNRFPKTKILSVSELRQAIHEFEQVELPEHKKIQECFARELEYAHEKEWEKFIEKGNVKRIIEGGEDYYKKPYTVEALACIRKLIEHARGVLISDLANQTKATYQLLELFDREYTVEKNHARAYRFDDITFQLSRFAQLKSLHLNSFRLDTQVSHLLLDEFQDTSLDQWKVLQPLANQLTSPPDQNSFFFMGGKTSFFCVGDPKQAIYGWRGGRAEIFDALPDQLGALEEMDLVKSYRSSQVVIDVVNQVFTRMKDHKNLGRAKPAVERWCENFPEHETQKSELPGFVQAVTSQFPQENQRFAAANWEYAATEIKKVHDQTEHFSIGVLVRRNVAVAEIVGHLRRLGVPASEERGGNQLSDSAGVQLLLSLIKLADHPGDTIARFHLATSVLASRLEFENHRDDRRAIEISREVRSRLMAQGYGKTLDGYAAWLVPHSSPRQRRRLQQLVQLAHAYEENATLRPTHFVHFVENKRVPDPTTARVRVMTVHQAKGLEFDIVFLPDIDNQLVSQFKSCVFRRDSPSEPVSQISRQCRKEIRSILTPDLMALFDQATYDDVTGELCLLYVAMTRAIHALHLVIQPGNPKSQYVSRLITNALSPDEPLDAERELFTHGDPNWYASMPVDDTGLAPDQQEPRHQVTCIQHPIGFSTADPVALSALPIRRPSMTKDSEVDQLELATTIDSLDSAAAKRSLPDRAKAIDASRLLDLRNLESAARGTLIHKWFQLVEWLDEGLPAVERMMDAARSIPLGSLELDQEILNFKKILSSENVRKNLTRKYYDETLHLFGGRDLEYTDAEAKNEWRFIFRDDQEFVSGTIDRFVLLQNGQRIVAADIIDYKTDILDPGSEASIIEKVNRYRGQLLEYRRAVETIYDLPTELITVRLFFVNYDLIETIGDNQMQSKIDR